MLLLLHPKQSVHRPLNAAGGRMNERPLCTVSSPFPPPSLCSLLQMLVSREAQQQSRCPPRGWRKQSFVFSVFLSKLVCSGGVHVYFPSDFPGSR